MKKSIIFVAMIAIAIGANAQWFDFSKNTNRIEIGVNLGMAGQKTEFHDFGLGASLSAWGVYLDFITAGPMYTHDDRNASMNDPYEQRFFPDSTTTTINLGYQVPVLPWLRIMPLVGININTCGHTDMATLHAETSGSGDNIDVQLTHNYNSERTWANFNFGGGIVISPIKWVSFYGVYTTNAIYGGLSFNLTSFAE